MADVFVSYSSKDLSIAQELAAELQASGYEVWWDYRLVGGANFRDAILNELTLARSVIVIWSDHSVDSEFVLDEADEARRAKKLVSTCVGDFQIERLPLGFRNRHTILVADMDRVELALDTLGVLRSHATGARRIKGGIYNIESPVTAGVVSLPPAQSDKFGYIPYHSDVLGVLFEYPSRILTLDTTRSSDGRFELVNDHGDTEVWIFRQNAQLPWDARAAQEAELRKLEESGCRITYKAPQLEKNWDNWYVLSGLDANKRWFYYRRWATPAGLVSIEYSFHASRKPLYNEVISDMTLRKFTFTRGAIDVER